MNIGVSSACFYPDMNTEDTIELCSSLGFRTMEIFLETQAEYTYDYCMMLKELCEKNKIDVYSIHAFTSSYEPFLFDAYKRRRDDTRKIFESICMAAKILGARCYVFHGKRRMECDERPNYKQAAGQMDILADIALEYGVSLSWENVSWCDTFDPSYIGNVLEYIKSDNLKFTLDLKQARKSGFKVQEYIEVMKDRIANVHISDGDNENICLLPGHGNIDFKGAASMLKTYGYQGPCIIEVYRNNYRNFHEIMGAGEYLRRMLK
jgi:Sugar phosphate isomerases/epimerases